MFVFVYLTKYIRQFFKYFFVLLVQVESTDTTSVVTIPVSLRTHSGRYTITAKNKSGQKHLNIRVIVLGMFVTFFKRSILIDD